jgi:hypothetical protein
VAWSEYGYLSLLYVPSSPYLRLSLTFQAAFASLGGAVIVLANILERMRMSPAVLAPIECLCMCAMAASSGIALSITLSLDAISETHLDASTSLDLMNFAMLDDLSRGYAMVAGAGALLFLSACIVVTMAAFSRARKTESCTFEPTASALGMGYEYAAITVPPTSRSRIPTMYDPRLPLRFDEDKERKVIQEKGLASKDVKIERADSAASEEGRISSDFEKETEVTGPLSLEKPDRVLQIRPSRPWSELPVTRKVDDGIHAI